MKEQQISAYHVETSKKDKIFTICGETSVCVVTSMSPSKMNESAATEMPHTRFHGRFVIIGFGSIGQGVLPLLLRHIEMRPGQITVITAETRGHEEAVEYGIEFIEAGLTRENYRAVLEPLLGRGDFLLNVSVDVSSV